MGDHTQNRGTANTHLHREVRQWVTPQQPSWERRSLFLQLLLWRPGDQLCHGTQGTPALPQHPRDPSFATAPSRLQISYEQSWGRSFPFKCWDFTSRIQALAQLCPSGAACWGAEQSPKRTQPFITPLVPQGEAVLSERCFAMSFAEPDISSAWTLSTHCHLHGYKQKKEKTFPLPQPKPLAQVQGNRLEPVHAHDVALLTEPQSCSKDRPQLLAGHHRSDGDPDSTCPGEETAALAGSLSRCTHHSS